MKEIITVRYEGVDGRTYSTPAAAIEGEFTMHRDVFIKWFAHGSYERPYVRFDGTPDETDKALDMCFAQLRKIRGANHRRRLTAKPR